MKKILFILLCSVAFIGASAQTGKGFRQCRIPFSKYAECYFGL